MARTWRDNRDNDDDDDDESDDWGGSDDYDPEDPETYPHGVYDGDNGELDTVPCPYCKAEILEDAEQCPRCGQYISREDRPPQTRSNGWIILMVLAFLTVLFWVFAG